MHITSILCSFCMLFHGVPTIFSFQRSLGLLFQVCYILPFRMHLKLEELCFNSRLYRCFCTTQEVIHPQSSIMIYNISFYRCILIFLQVVHFSIVCTINISSCFNLNYFQTKISVAKDGFKNYSLFRDKITEALVTFFN